MELTRKGFGFSVTAKCRVVVDGALPKTLGLAKSELRSAAEFFAAALSEYGAATTWPMTK